MRLPKIISTYSVVSSNHFCQTGIVADNPTIHPDPGIDPIPAPTAKREYSFNNAVGAIF